MNNDPTQRSSNVGMPRPPDAAMSVQRTVTLSVLIGIMGVLFLLISQVPTERTLQPWGLAVGVLLTGTAAWTLIAGHVPGLSSRVRRGALITTMVLAALTILLNVLALFIG